jgi:carbamoylphosphate synthase large subunit
MKALILSKGNYQGPARFPFALKNAGFEVASLSEKTNLIAKSDFVDRSFFDEMEVEAAILATLETAIGSFRPDILLPGSDGLAFLLQILRRKIAAGNSKLDSEMVDMVHACTFDEESERLLFNKIDLLETLGSLGVLVPPQREIATLGDAGAFIEDHGYPVILKPNAGSGSSGVHICKDEEALFVVLPGILANRGRGRYCIQKYLGSQTGVVHFVAKNGALVAWNMAFRVATHPGETGQTSATRVIENSQMLETAKKICELTNYSGMGAPQFVLEDEGRGRAWLMEMNPRMGTYVHLWQRIGTDLALGLMHAWQGRPLPSAPVRHGLTVALFPQELRRDRTSPHLEGMHDIPLEDSGLMAAYRTQLEREGISIEAGAAIG